MKEKLILISSKIYYKILKVLLFLHKIIMYKKMKKVYLLENEDYNYCNKYHDFMKTSKFFDVKIPLAKINLEAKIKKSLTIGICLRNCEKYCNINFEKINKICNLFESSQIIFYENGSNDSTLNLLKIYCDKNPHTILLHEEYQTDDYPRTVRLARGRNICLNIAKIINNDIYITLDFDDILYDLNVDNIVKCFKEEFKWGGLFANQKGIYYDLWALRTYDKWMEYDCWEAASIIGRLFAVTIRNIIIPKDKIIKTKSAFGGLGIYDLSKLKDCYYYGWKNNKSVCEHVHLHKQINKKKVDLYIIGYLINN